MAKPKTQSPAMSPDALHWFTIRGAYRLAIKDAMDGTTVAPGSVAEGATAGTSGVSITFVTPTLTGFSIDPNASGTSSVASGGNACGVTTSYECNYLNEGFTNVDEHDPEKQPGAWPPSDALNQQIAQAFTSKKPASTTIPLQLQANTLESYRRQLLHKKWRKCHHLNAVNASLVAELRSQDEMERLLLGQQVGNQPTS